MEITREWLDSISDERGLTNGQQQLLLIWCKEAPYVGKVIPDQVAHVIETCRGYRGIPQSVRDHLMWT
jgi:hypothetical protein